MDQILNKASNQVVTFAIRSGISLASGFAIKTITKFLDKLPESEKIKIQTLRNKVQTKADIVSISSDLIKLACARGNSSLEATVLFLQELNEEIDTFDTTVNDITSRLTGGNEKESVRQVELYLKALLQQINDAIPILTLSLVTAGVNLNGALQKGVSPGRLLQASNYINKANESGGPQVGPTFDLVMYTIFYNPSRMKYINGEQDDELSSITWKETFARSLVRIIQEPDYKYTFEIKEDFNDGRYHDEEEEPAKTKTYNTELIQRMFFSASGTLLKLEGRNSPVLIIKLVDGDSEEWIALGEINLGEFDDDDDNDDDDDDDDEEEKEEVQQKTTSLSLLEYLVRLSKLQHIEQKQLLQIKDEVLSLYLRDEIEGRDDTVIPKTTKQKQVDTRKKSAADDKITLESNIRRLNELDIQK